MGTKLTTEQKAARAAKAAATKAAKAAAKVQTREIFAPDVPLMGTPLFALTVANLRLCGLFEPRATATAGAITAPYASGTMLRHHAANGNFRKDPTSGRWSLTPQGAAYFTSRTDGSRTSQQVTEEQIAAARSALKSGGTFAGVAFTQKRTIKI